MTGIIDAIYRANHELALKSQQSQSGADKDVDVQAKITEGKHIIETISRLKYQMGRDNAFEYVLTWNYSDCCLFRPGL